MSKRNKEIATKKHENEKDKKDLATKGTKLQEKETFS